MLPRGLETIPVRRLRIQESKHYSRVGTVSKEPFAKRVDELGKAGAKYIVLKTGVYRPPDLARAILFASKYELDLLAARASGGGCCTPRCTTSRPEGGKHGR